jgi:hypothetical protein
MIIIIKLIDQRERERESSNGILIINQLLLTTLNVSNRSIKSLTSCINCTRKLPLYGNSFSFSIKFSGFLSSLMTLYY